MAEDVKLTIKEPEDLEVEIEEARAVALQMKGPEVIALQVAGEGVINVRTVVLEHLRVCLSEPEAIRVTIVGGVLGHGVASPITDHGDVESSGEQDNDVLVYDLGKGKYANKQILSFDEVTDEVIISLN